MGMCGSTDLDTGETHEGHGEETGADHCDRHTTHCLGDGCPCELLADTGKDGDSHSETDCGCESIDDALAEIHVLLHDRDGHTEDGAVSGDEREEYTERAVEHGGDLLEDDLKHLHEGGDHEDEDDGLHELQPEGCEDEILKQPCDGGGDDHYESHGCTHADCARKLARHSDERTDAEELGEDDVVDKDRRYDDGNIFKHDLNSGIKCDVLSISQLFISMILRGA